MVSAHIISTPIVTKELNNMLKRDAIRYFENWKKTKKNQGLLVTGARQVGKTFLVREFASKNYKNFVEINLLENKQAVSILSDATDSSDLNMRISILAGEELVPNETLIFFDEVQEYKEIVTAVKFLVKNDEYDFVLSGSLLGVELKDIRSVPVGYLDIVNMYPLTLKEFFISKGVSKDILDVTGDCFINRREIPDYIHKHLMKLFYEYLIVGGMPAAVDAFCSSNNLQTVRRIHGNLIEQNKWDISKYNREHALSIKNIYDLIPGELNRQNKRFLINNINKNARFGRYENLFVWLADAGVALPAYNVEEPVYPLKLSQASNLFKLFMADVGLLTSSFIKDTTIDILNRDPDINYGSIFENFVAQELCAKGFEFYYYKNKKRGELDFVIENRQGKVTPIEVKSGKDYKRHKALNSVLSMAEYKIDEGFVLYDGNVLQEGNISYLPVYTVAFFEDF